MALNSYSGLKNAALAWIDHAGVVGATSIIDDCVTLCEARINKTPTLRLSAMETAVVLTLEGTAGAPLPSDCLAIKRVVAVSSGEGGGSEGGFDTGFDAGFDIGGDGGTSSTGSPRLLSYAEPGWCAEHNPIDFYTIIGTRIYARSGTLSVLYYAKVPSLATTDPNWLLTKAPDVYLYGTILEVLNALEGDATGKYAGMYNSAVESLIASETFSRGGVLTMRASMPAP